MLATAHRLMGSPHAAAVVTVTSDDSLSFGALVLVSQTRAARPLAGGGPGLGKLQGETRKRR